MNGEFLLLSAEDIIDARSLFKILQVGIDDLFNSS